MGECHRNKENGNFFQQSREFRIKLHGTKKRHKSWDYMSIGTFTLENREIHSIKSGHYVDLIGTVPLGKLSFA